MREALSEDFEDSEQQLDNCIHRMPASCSAPVPTLKVSCSAERRAGELLAEMPKAKGAMGIGTSAVPPGNPTLSDIGVSKKQSKTWQDLAKVDEEAFEEPLGPEMSQERCPSRCPARMRQQ